MKDLHVLAEVFVDNCKGRRMNKPQAFGRKLFYNPSRKCGLAGSETAEKAKETAIFSVSSTECEIYVFSVMMNLISNERGAPAIFYYTYFITSATK